MYIKVSSILRHYKTRTQTNTVLCKHGEPFNLAPEWKSRHYHVNTPFANLVNYTTSLQKPSSCDLHLKILYSLNNYHFLYFFFAFIARVNQITEGYR